MAQRGDLESAARFVAASPPQLMPIDKMTMAAVAAGARNRQPGRLRDLCGAVPRTDGLTFPCIVAFSEAGDLDSAFAMAFASFPRLKGVAPAEEDAAWLANLTDPATPLTADAYLASPALAAMRRDPRFLELADRAGLLSYWRSGRLPDFCRRTPERICAAL
jgi:hypothetical protein